MRFLQVNLFYDAYLRSLDHHRNGCRDLTFDQQQRLLWEDGFSACYYFAEGMAGLGHETMMVVANDRISQEAWQRENRAEVGPPVISGPTGAWGQALPPDLLAILLAQIRKFDPDVLFFQDPISLDSRFLALLPKRPKLVVAWRASEVPKKTDWSDFDLLVSSHTPSLRAAKARGARWQEFLQPGFPERLARAVEGAPKCREVAFCGQLSHLHRRRTELLTSLAMDQLGPGRPYGLHFAVNTDGKTPAGVAMHAIAPVYGKEMHKFIRSAQICLNIHAELAERTGGNMRVFEVTGSGSFLLTDMGRIDHELFRPGQEIETFRDLGELRQKIRFYMENPEARERIARAGQQKCLREFSLQKAAAHLEILLERALQAGSRRRFGPFHPDRWLPGLCPVPA